MFDDVIACCFVVAAGEQKMVAWVLAILTDKQLCQARKVSHIGRFLFVTELYPVIHNYTPWKQLHVHVHVHVHTCSCTYMYMYIHSRFCINLTGLI